MANRIQRPSEQALALFRATADANIVKREKAQFELAAAIQEVLREGVLVGDIVRGIFQQMPLEPGATAEFPLDLLSPGTEVDHVAYSNPGNGRIPERHVEGDYVQMPTYSIASSIDWLLSYARSANYNVLNRALQVLEASVVKKLNDDGWHTVVAAGADRNILVFDADASNGQFTKRLVSLAKTVMRRNAGGNSASLSRGRLTDIALSPEALEDIRNWGIDQVDEVTRREIYVAGDGDATLTRVFGVNLHDLDEFGESQEYQLFFTNQLGGSLNGSDTELAVAIDLSSDDSFVMPIRQEFEVQPDPTLARWQREGFFGAMEAGFGVLDERRTLLLSF